MIELSLVLQLLHCSLTSSRPSCINQEQKRMLTEDYDGNNLDI
jgi:hypothetical protein